MHIAIVGPTHPYKGGIVLHTTELAHQLQAVGHEVTLFGWKNQYPWFYPGQQYVDPDKPEKPLFPHTVRRLRWNNPFGWWRLARQLKAYDKIIFVWWVPTIQGPVYSLMLAALGKAAERSVVLCHNVLPHESRPGDRRLTKAVFSKTGQVLVHTSDQAELARQLTTKPVTVAELPLTLPAPKPKKITRSQHLLFFGLVRPYKGLDVLLKAMVAVPEASLTVAGEFWGGSEMYEALVGKLGLSGRVVLQNGYLPAAELAQAISQATAVVLPYTSGTGTWNARLAHAYGAPVIATTAGSLGEQVRNGIDGLLCKPNDAASLAAALRTFYRGHAAERLRKGIRAIDSEAEWRTYAAAVVNSDETV